MKLEGNHLRKYSKKENFEKDIMHLIEANHQINMTFDHFVSSNTLCKKITKVVLPSGCCFGSVCCKTDVNAQGWSETSFDDESNKEAIKEKIDKNYIQTLLAQVQQSNHY